MLPVLSRFFFFSFPVSGRWLSLPFFFPSLALPPHGAGMAIFSSLFPEHRGLSSSTALGGDHLFPFSLFFQESSGGTLVETRKGWNGSAFLSPPGHPGAISFFPPLSPGWVVWSGVDCSGRSLFFFLDGGYFSPFFTTLPRVRSEVP